MPNSQHDKLVEILESLLNLPGFCHPLTETPGVGPHDAGRQVKFRSECETQQIRVRELLGSLPTTVLENLQSDEAQRLIFKQQHVKMSSHDWFEWGFSVKGFEPDWAYWLMLETWTLEEATCLSIGFKPQKMPPSASPVRDRFQRGTYRTIEFFWKRLHIIRLSGCSDVESPDLVRSEKLIQWAEKKGLPVPTAFLSMRPGLPVRAVSGAIRQIDARQYDSALKVILGLLAGSDGDDNGEASLQARADVLAGLKKIGLNPDRKTINAVFARAAKELPRFLKEQEKRDQ